MTKYFDLVVDENLSIKKVLAKITKNKKDICFIVKSKKLIGMATGGDIRRALLRDISINENISKAMNTNFISARVNSEKKEIKKLKVLKSGTKTLHNNYRKPLEKRMNDNIIGPEELLREIKEKLITPRYEKNVRGFIKIEKHNPESFDKISYKKKKDGLKYDIPSPILYGYYILKKIMN